MNHSLIEIGSFLIYAFLSKLAGFCNIATSVVRIFHQVMLSLKISFALCFACHLWLPKLYCGCFPKLEEFILKVRKERKELKHDIRS